MRGRRSIVLIGIAVAIAGFFAFGLDRYLTLDALKQRLDAVVAVRDAHPVLTSAGYFVVYVAVAALSIPGAAALTLLGGAIFGLLWGVLLVSFASSIGASLAFLLARTLFREGVQRRFATQVETVDRGIAKEGAFYVIALRLVPLFPFFLVNLAMALTALPLRTFYWSSQLGMLPGTIAYVNAGRELSSISSAAGVLSPSLIASFTALGLLPLVARRVIDAIRLRRIYARWPRPKRYDRNVVVIGAGSAGLVSAFIAAAVKAKVTIVEKHRMGGDCLNTGCVPSKALIRSARLLATFRRAPEFGIDAARAEVNFPEAMARVQRVIRAIEPHDSRERFEGLGVEVLEGEARITSPFTVQVTEGDRGATLTTRSIVIATGARPLVPPIPGIEDVGYVTSDNVWDVRELPKRLLVLGGGPIGCELAQCFARFGSKVILVEMMPRLLAREDDEFSRLIQEQFAAEGMDLRLGHKALRFERRGAERVVFAEHEETSVEIGFDLLLCALGRKPNIEGYGLEDLGIPSGTTQTIETDDFLQTPYPNIFACGDVAGPYQFTHTAAHQAWYATVNALFGQFRRFRADYSVIPWVTFTDPEIARVGLSEREALERKIPHEVTRYSLDELDRAITDGATRGEVKVLTAPGRDRILGVTIAGEHAGELIAEFVLAMKHRIGLNNILGTIHAYPTWPEANKYVAANWKRAHLSPRLLAWLGRYHAWRLG